MKPKRITIDEEMDWLIRHLRCEWGIRTPEECEQINDPCVPCALRLRYTRALGEEPLWKRAAS